MKTKYSLAKLIIFFTPYIAYAIVLAIPYGGVMHTLYTAINADTVKPHLYYYVIGLSLLIPLVVIKLANNRIKHLWQYLVFTIIIVALSFVLTRCYVYPILVLAFSVARIASRLNEEESFMDSFHWAMLLAPVLYFIICGFHDLEFYQFYALLSFIVLCVLYFTFYGLLRIDDYLSMNKDMANFPYMRIMKQSNTLFIAIAFTLLAILVPVMVSNYEFVHLEFDIEEMESSYEEEVVEEEEASGSSGESESMAEMLGVEEKSWAGWDVLTWLFVAVIVYYGAIFLYKTIKNFIFTFNKNSVVVEKDDVIESTVDLMDKYEKFKKEKVDKVKFFDFSPNAVVRKKYKKSVKAKKSKEIQNWQSPAEIEKTVKLEDEKLHFLYEKARYSQNGVTKEEI
ncbi:MAG: hypothetical protein R3Y35_09615 [Clostridia bacterium]